MPVNVRCGEVKHVGLALPLCAGGGDPRSRVGYGALCYIADDVEGLEARVNLPDPELPGLVRSKQPAPIIMPGHVGDRCAVRLGVFVQAPLHGVPERNAAVLPSDGKEWKRGVPGDLGGRRRPDICDGGLAIWVQRLALGSEKEELHREFI